MTNQNIPSPNIAYLDWEQTITYKAAARGVPVCNSGVPVYTALSNSRTYSTCFPNIANLLFTYLLRF